MLKGAAKDIYHSGLTLRLNQPPFNNIFDVLGDKFFSPRDESVIPSLGVDRDHYFVGELGDGIDDIPSGFQVKLVF